MFREYVLGLVPLIGTTVVSLLLADQNVGLPAATISIGAVYTMLFFVTAFALNFDALRFSNFWWSKTAQLIKITTAISSTWATGLYLDDWALYAAGRLMQSRPEWFFFVVYFFWFWLVLETLGLAFSTSREEVFQSIKVPFSCWLILKVIAMALGWIALLSAS